MLREWIEANVDCFEYFDKHKRYFRTNSLNAENQKIVRSILLHRYSFKIIEIKVNPFANTL